MEISEHRIEEACGRDTPSTFRHVNFNAKKHRLEASNGKILAVVPARKCADDKAGPIPVEAIKAARKGSAKGRMVLGDNVEVPLVGEDFERFTPAEPGDVFSFPSVDDVTPKHSNNPPDIILDADLLRRLARAIDKEGKVSNGVELWFKRDMDGKIDGRGAILAKSTKPGGAYGVIMPIDTRPVRQ